MENEKNRQRPYPVAPPRYSVAHHMVTTAFELPGFRIVRNLGVVRGITVRSRSVFGTIGGSSPWRPFKRCSASAPGTRPTPYRRIQGGRDMLKLLEDG